MYSSLLLHWGFSGFAPSETGFEKNMFCVFVELWKIWFVKSEWNFFIANGHTVVKKVMIQVQITQIENLR